jgi:triphosphoribosyl-dephospho-CoA synthase
MIKNVRCQINRETSYTCLSSNNISKRVLEQDIAGIHKTINSIPRLSFNISQNADVRDQSIEIAGLAVQAMLYEVSCHPSPGLVTRASLGAHQDMDYFTFLDSVSALIHPLIYCAEAGFSLSTPKEVFQKIRLIGQIGEQRMFQKTSGVNTHKGMLFLLGVCCAAGGKALYNGLSFSSLQGIIQEMTEDLVEEELCSRLIEFQNSDQSTLTHGERLYLNYRIEGIRGEVQRGLPIVFGFALQFYKDQKGLSQNLRLVQTLLAIMQYCEDSNVLHRHTPKTLQEVQNQAKHILSMGGVTTAQGMNALEVMAEDFAKRRISPGGSADLLGVTVFLYFLEKYMKKARP